MEEKLDSKQVVDFKELLMPEVIQAEVNKYFFLCLTNHQPQQKCKTSMRNKHNYRRAYCEFAEG